MKPLIQVTTVSNTRLLFETRTHILDNCKFCSCTHTGIRVVLRADSNYHIDAREKPYYYLDVSIMDDDDYDDTFEFWCTDVFEFVYKLELLIDWLKDVSGCYVFYDELCSSIPIYNEGVSR